MLSFGGMLALEDDPNSEAGSTIGQSTRKQILEEMRKAEEEKKLQKDQRKAQLDAKRKEKEAKVGLDSLMSCSDKGNGDVDAQDLMAKFREAGLF